MKNKLEELRAEADELGVSPELLALCYIHEALATLQVLIDRNYEAAKRIEATYTADGPPCNQCREYGVDSKLCKACMSSPDEPFPGFARRP